MGSKTVSRDTEEEISVLLQRERTVSRGVVRQHFPVDFSLNEFVQY